MKKESRRLLVRFPQFSLPFHVILFALSLEKPLSPHSRWWNPPPTLNLPRRLTSPYPQICGGKKEEVGDKQHSTSGERR